VLFEDSDLLLLVQVTLESVLVNSIKALALKLLDYVVNQVELNDLVVVKLALRPPLFELLLLYYDFRGIFVTLLICKVGYTDLFNHITFVFLQILQ
jgi:hypothetical protein